MAYLSSGVGVYSIFMLLLMKCYSLSIITCLLLLLFQQLREKSEKAESEMTQRKEAFHQGRTLGISGREMFLFNPDLVGGDDQDEEGGAVLQVTRPELDEVHVHVTSISHVSKLL